MSHLLEYAHTPAAAHWLTYAYECSGYVLLSLVTYVLSDR